MSEKTTMTRYLRQGRREGGLSFSLFIIRSFGRSLLLVSPDDLLHERVPHHVLLGKIEKLYPLDAFEDGLYLYNPDARLSGRSICVTSPVTTVFDEKPRRVRNIFICSDAVF